MSQQRPDWPNEGYRTEVGGTTYVADSLQWWDKEPPPSGPILETDFNCEFLPPLATVVGSDVDQLADLGFNVVPWDRIALPTRRGRLSGLERVPGITFVARGKRPHTDAALRDVRVTFPSGRRLVRVLNNRRRTRKSSLMPLTLEFHLPQRAVALEYGALIGAEDPQPRRRDVELRAFDATGSLLPATVSNGEKIDPLRALLERNSVFEQIGVVDKEGRIAKVELRFRAPPRYAQVIYRVWHEPMPIGGVRQGEIDFTADDPLQPSQGALELRLPLWCDRAVAFLRGFKLAFADGQPREFKTFEARLGGDTIYSGPKGGLLRLRPEARLYASFQGDPKSEGRLYVTVLAWDSEQAEIFVGNIGHQHHSTQGHSVAEPLTVQVRAPDPSPVPLAERVFVSNIEDVCGTVAVFLRGFRFDRHRNSKYDGIALGYDGVGRVGVVGESIQWPVWYWLEGRSPDNLHDHALWVEGPILTGRSLTSQNPDLLLAFTRIRDNPDPIVLTWQEIRRQGATPVLDAEVAGLSMGAFFSQSRYDAIREVAVQLSGERHDGLSLDWSVRAGVKVKPVDEREPRGARWLRGWPHFVGLKPTRSFNSGRGRTSHLHTDPTAIGLRREAEQPGYLRNIGAGGLALYDCRLGSSPEDREFIWYFYLRGVRYSLDGLTEALPLVLRPSETLWIMTLFMPTYLVSPSTTGFVRLFTNDPHTPQAVVATNGQALEAMPAGRWEPGMLDFGNVRVLVAASSVARLLSTGTTPLVASNVRFGRPSPALTFEVRPNLGEDGLVIRVTYRPTAVDDTLSPNLDRLIADTNAGELVLPLTGTAVA